MTKQTTLVSPIQCHGIGLHSGQDVQMTIKPAEANTGIVFKRMDVERKKALVPARFDAVVETRLGTTIENKHGVRVQTIEHLMAALWGADIDNAIIELSGAEVPIMDGSSEPFVFMLECAGVARLSAARKVLRIVKPVEVALGRSSALIEPLEDRFEGLTLDISIDFESAFIARQHARFDFNRTTFKQALSRARTFGFAHEVEALRTAGLARGGSLENAIVVGDEGIMNEGGLRYADEFVRHKALDVLGDLFLCGWRIEGALSFIRPGHCINNALARALMADKEAWMLVHTGSESASHRSATAEAAAYLSPAK